MERDAQRQCPEKKYSPKKHVRSHSFSPHADLCCSRKLAPLKQCYRSKAKCIEKLLHSLSFFRGIFFFWALSSGCVLAKHVCPRSLSFAFLLSPSLFFYPIPTNLDQSLFHRSLSISLKHMKCSHTIISRTILLK